jgi:hypothetical protein
MAIFLEEKKYTPEYFSAGTPNLLANKNARIEFLIRFRVETFVELAAGITEITVGTLNGANNFVFDSTFDNSFAEFKVGDTINFSGFSPNINGNYVISEKHDNNTIRLATTPAHTGVFDDGFIRLVQEPLAISYDFSFAQGSGVYDSELTGELQRYFLANPTQISTSFSPMFRQFSQAAEFSGGSTVECRRVSSDTTNYRYVFEIKHTFIFNPFIIPTEVQNYLANFQFLSDNPKGHNIRIRAYETPTTNAIFQEFRNFEIGNTAEYERNYSNSPKAYNLSAVSLNVGANVVPTLMVNEEVKAKFTITANPTHAAVTFYIIPPDNDSFDASNPQTFAQLWAFDRATKSAAGSDVVGANGIIKNFKTTVSGSTLICEVDIYELDVFPTVVRNLLLARYNNNEPIRYFLSVTAIDNSVNVVNSKNSELIISSNTYSFYIDEDDVTNDITFVRHDNTEETAPILKVADEVVLKIDGKVESVPGFQSATFNIRLFIEDSFLQKTQLFEEVLSTLGLSNISTPSIITKVRNDEIRKNNTLLLDVVLGTTNDLVWEINLPFFTRYEFWQQIQANILSIPQIFDTTQKFNGYNQNWARLDSLNMQFFVEVETVLSFGTSGGYSSKVRKDFDVKDFIANTLFINEKIEIFNEAGTTLQVHNTQPYLLKNAVNKVVATFEYDGSGDIPAPIGVLRMHDKEVGIAAQSNSLSSLYDRSNVASNFWQNVANSGLVEVDVTGNIITLTAYIDGTKIQSNAINKTIVATLDFPDQNNTYLGEVVKQDVLLIDTKEFDDPDHPELPKKPFESCCYERVVFGDVESLDEFKNDFNSFYHVTNLLNDSEVIELYKNGVKVADLDELANLGIYRKVVRERNIVYIYTINWRQVLVLFGGGCYHTEFMGKKSEKFSLKQYHKNLANKTVRIDFTLNNTIGDRIATIRNDFNDLNIVDSVRFNRAIFGFCTFPIEEEKTRLDNGFEKTTFRAFREEYELKIAELPIELHKLFKYRILLSEEIVITDYNSENHGGNYTKVSVKPTGDYSPNYTSSKLPLIYKFLAAYTNTRLIYEKESIIEDIVGQFTPVNPFVCSDATYEVLDQNSVSYASGSIASGDFETINIIIPKELNIAYEEDDDTIIFTVLSGSEGVYTTINTTGLTSVVIEVNSTVVTAPITLAIGDIVEISFDPAAADGVIIFEE